MSNRYSQSAGNCYSEIPNYQTTYNTPDAFLYTCLIFLSLTILLFYLSDESSDGKHVNIIASTVPDSNQREEDYNNTVGFKEKVTENWTDERDDAEQPVEEIEHSTATPEREN